MKNKLKIFFTKFEFLRKVLFPISFSLKLFYMRKIRKNLEESFLKDLIMDHYSNKSIKEKRFYNFGAGNQRSKFSFWKYVDLKSENYNNDGIDIFYDLESQKNIPIKSNTAEVIFSSFVLEHISYEATKKFSEEAFRILKKGGVFHSKIHCYDYGLSLLKRNLNNLRIPFHCRESNKILEDFMLKYNSKVKAVFENGNYIVKSIDNPVDEIKFSPEKSFLFSNAVSTIESYERGDFNNSIFNYDKNSKIYNNLKKHININKKQPHQHNADYIDKNLYIEYLNDLGFKDVYFTQPFQSASPALWEDVLNPIHHGYLFSIEAIK